MKKLLLAILLSTGVLVSMCSEDSMQNVRCNSQYSVDQDSLDRQAIRAFVVRKGMDSVYTTASGLSYKIIIPGDENRKPKDISLVGVDYRGSMVADTLGKAFDSGTHKNFKLNGVIKGWTEGLQLIGEGGQIRLMIPSHLAYGSCGSQDGSIPKNSPLVFDIKLVQLY
jgi:FKBP-type peptidyl-prolyl cis-trans isomerase FkpA